MWKLVVPSSTKFNIKSLCLQKHEWSVPAARNLCSVCSQLCASILHSVPNRGASYQLQASAACVWSQQTGLLAGDLLLGYGSTHIFHRLRFIIWAWLVYNKPDLIFIASISYLAFKFWTNKLLVSSINKIYFCTCI